MKKTVSFAAALLFAVCSFAQPVLVVEAPLNNSSTSANRAPNGTAAHAFMRGCFLVLASELTNIPPNTSLTSFGYTLSSGTAGTAVSGNYTLFLENTSNNTYQKGTTWATAVSGMTQVYASVLTVPLSAGTISVMITLSSPFNYTGGGLYVAYDWVSGTPYSTTAAIYLCEAAALPLPGGGGATGASGTSAPTTLGLTNFRPSFLFGFNNPFTNDAQVVGLSAPGRIPAMFNTPHQIHAIVKNSSSGALSNISVSLTVTGANPFTDVQSILSLGAGASSQVNFAAFNPQTPGHNTIVVSVATDQNNTNNSLSYSQSVTCNEWALNPATGTYTSTSVGFDTGSGIIGIQYSNPVTSTISGVRIAVSSNTPSIGRSIYGALLSATGATLAVSNPITITSGMLGTFVDFTFTAPQQLSANTTYYIGAAQTAANPGYHPFGTLGSAYLPGTPYGYTGLAGGAITVLTQNFGYFGIVGIFTPTITLAVTPQTVTCGDQATVNAVSSTNYSWSTGAQTSSIQVTPTVSTVYTVVATNTLGCVNEKTVQVIVNPLPVNIQVANDTICLGSTVTLTATGGSSYIWSNNSTLPVVTDNPQQFTVYSVTASIPAGCANVAALGIAVRNFSTMALQPVTQTICIGATTTLVASGASSYTWDSGTSTVSTPTLSDAPLISTIYSVTGTDHLGCTMTRTAGVTVISIPLVVSPDTAVCFGSFLQLTAGGGNSYLWSTGLPFATLTIPTTTVSETFTVTVTGPSNCKASAAINVSVNPNPTITASASRSVMCVKESNVLTALGAPTFSWANGAQTASITITPTLALPVNMKVWGIDENGCKDEFIVQVKVNSCTGLGEMENPGFRAYPNPGTGLFTVETDDGGDGLWEAFDATGRKVGSGLLTNGKTNVDLRSNAAGLYMVELSRSDRPLARIRLILQ